MTTETTPDFNPKEPYFDQYEVLVPDPRATKFRDMNPNAPETKVAVLEDYLTQFDKMVSKIQDRDGLGVPYDTVIFLDKSARPLSWMLSELWDDFAETQTEAAGNEVLPQKPDQKFLNIDRLHWRKDQETENEFNDVSPTDIEALRAIFQLHDRNVLDGAKKILIVDEISESGDTQRIAAKLLHEAFPNAQIDTFAYMTPEITETKAGPSYNYRSFPAWYPPKGDRGYHTEDGRGVLDPSTWDAQVSLERPRRANKFLSSPPQQRLPEHKIREATIALMQELELLETTPDSEVKQAQRELLLARLAKLSTGTVVRDPKADKLRRDVKRLGRDFRAGLLLPAVTAERTQIGGRSADLYYQARHDKNLVHKPVFEKKK